MSLLSKDEIRVKVLKMLPKEGHRKAFMRKVILMVAYLHLEKAIIEKDEMIESQMTIIQDEIDYHLGVIQFSKKEAKIIDLLKENKALKELEETEINFVYFSMLLLNRLLKSSLVKNFNIFSKASRAKIKMYKVRVNIYKGKVVDKEKLEVWESIQKDTEKIAKLSWERHKFLFGLKGV